MPHLLLHCPASRATAGVLLAALGLLATELPVDPTFLHRYLPEVAAKKSDLTTASCHYKPLFGAGDSETSVVKGVARYGEITVDAAGRCALVTYPAEEQVYYILEGRGLVQYGEERTPVKKDDFMYLAPGVKHGVVNESDQPLRLIVMGFKIPKGVQVTAPPKLLAANASRAEKQVVGGHPPSTLYQLLMGDLNSKRDIIAAGHVLTSLFIMEIAPGGTNHPHHHPTEEEIYLLLEGRGHIVAGGGTDGIEGRHPAKPGEAYFFRLNCTVGFYADDTPGSGKTRILAVRSLYPADR